MLNELSVSLLMGAVLGFLSGLGIGGGSLLILWLTLVLGMDPADARSINLLFYIPSALASSLIRIRRGDPPRWQTVLPATAAGCIAAVIFSSLQSRMDMHLLRKLFGLLLLAAGTRELLYHGKKN